MSIETQVKQLELIANRIRIETIKSIYKAGSGHSGGSLSAADIMAVLFFSKMNIQPQNPNWAKRDRFILSKGHAGPALYSTLALKGFFPLDELVTLRQMGSRLSGHPACFKTPGVDMTSGSLGQGLSVGLGMRLAARVTKEDYRVFVLLGDGELEEGEVWEAAMAATHFKMTRLIAIVDNNRIQLDGTVGEIMEIEPLTTKWAAFGWQVITVDGHDIKDLFYKIDEAIKRSDTGPVVVIASTVKGKGVSFMENTAEWHGRTITEPEFIQAMQELTLINGGEAK